MAPDRLDWLVSTSVSTCDKATDQRWSSDLSEAPGHSSSLLVHLGATHHLLPSLEQHQRGKLLGEWRCGNLVPEEKTKKSIIFISALPNKAHHCDKARLAVKTMNGWKFNVLPFGNLSITANIHFTKLEASTVVPKTQRQKKSGHYGLGHWVDGQSLT